MTKKRIIVNGAAGKMGKLACASINQDPAFELIGSLSRANSLRQAIVDTKADIVVDLTSAASVFENSKIIIENNAHPVIGTSGLIDTQIQQLIAMANAKQLGGIIVPNFSIAAVLMMRFAAEAAVYLADVEIVEAHHPQKYDAPSGTAMRTADMIARARNQFAPESTEYTTVPNVRGGKYYGINLHSIRIHGVLAQQQVLFGNIGETLTIIHNSIDRTCFMPGLIHCCKKVSQLQTLYYGLENLL